MTSTPLVSTSGLNLTRVPKEPAGDAVPVLPSARRAGCTGPCHEAGRLVCFLKCRCSEPGTPAECLPAPGSPRAASLFCRPHDGHSRWEKQELQSGRPGAGASEWPCSGWPQRRPQDAGSRDDDTALRTAVHTKALLVMTGFVWCR